MLKIYLKSNKKKNKKENKKKKKIIINKHFKNNIDDTINETFNYAQCKTKLKEIWKTKFKDTRINYIISIKVAPNNVFCLLKKINILKKKKNICFEIQKSILLLSAGILKLKTSKNKIQFACTIIIEKFIRKIEKKLRKKRIIIEISGPQNIRTFLLNKLIFSLKKTEQIMLNTPNKKIFNGCRVKKKRKKKQKGLQIFK